MSLFRWSASHGQKGAIEGTPFYTLYKGEGKSLEYLPENICHGHTILELSAVFKDLLVVETIDSNPKTLQSLKLTVFKAWDPGVLALGLLIFTGTCCRYPLQILIR